MAGGWALLIELVGMLAAAFLLGALAERFRQSAVIGYILAGVLLGPGVAGFVREVDTVGDLSELGVGLVLFTIGLEFSWQELRKLGRLATVGGALQILFTWAAFTVVGSFFFANRREALGVGAIAALSSTVVVLRALKERGDLDAPHGRASLGILLMQDIALIPLVLLFTALGPGKSLQTQSWTDFGGTFAAVVLVLVAFMVAMLLVLPRLLASSALARNRELPVLLAVTTCIGAAWAAYNLGVSPALGAFVAGILLAETGYASQLRADVAPLRALFATVFFASIGMSVNVQWFFGHLPLVLGSALLLVALKALTSMAAVRSLRMTASSSAAAGISLAQIGELSFILLQIGLAVGLLQPETGQLVTSVAVLTLLACPYLVGKAPEFGRWAASRILSKKELSEEEERTQRIAGHIVIVGFGEAGRSASATMKASGQTVLVLDVDRKLVRQALDWGYSAFLADGTQTENLEHAHLAQAKGLIVALSDHRSVALVSSQARRLAPDLPIVARARYHLFQEEITEAGANHVVDEEASVGKLLGEELAHHLGLIWEHEGR